MNHFYRSSEDFRPKRLVYKNPFEKPGSAPKESPKKQRQALRVRVDKKVQDGVKEAYEKKQDDVKKFIREVGVNPYKSWTEWNKQFAEKMEMEGVKPTLQVAALQRMAFDALGLLKHPRDPAAVIDGKLGPYTMAALAQYAKLQGGDLPPVPKGSKKLAKAREEYVEQGVTQWAKKNQAAMESYGMGQLARAKKQPDGSYLIEDGGVKTYFKFIDGKWKWAGQEGKDKGDWVVAGEKPWDTEKNPALAHVNALALRLSKARTTMRAGASLMQGMEMQADGTYLSRKSGKRTYFRFWQGKWQWASEAQKGIADYKGWVDVGKDHYSDGESDEINKLSDDLAKAQKEAEEAAKAQENEIENGKMRQALEEAKKKDKNFDPKYAYVIKEGNQYVVKTWKPVSAGWREVSRSNSEALRKQGTGKTIRLHIDGEVVMMTRHPKSVFSLEGSDKKMGFNDMLKEAARIAARKRQAKKPPEGIPAEEVNAPKKQREGAALIAGAVPQGNGIYLVKTKGKQDTYFRYKDGKWEWASTQQKNRGEWVSVAGDHYTDNAYKDVNDIAKKLAGQTEKPLTQEEAQKVAAYAAAATIPFGGLYAPIIAASWHPPMAPPEEPAPLNPTGDPNLAFLEWDPSKGPAEADKPKDGTRMAQEWAWKKMNPQNKPIPDGTWSYATLQGYYNSPPGMEPPGGPLWPAGYPLPEKNKA